MLNNTLGILIGYVTVILLFSLLVTTLSQAIQNALSVRSNNLRKGVAWLVQESAKKANLNLTAGVSPAFVATQVVEQDVTWIEKEELKSDLTKAGFTPPAEFDLQFEVMSRYLTKNFTKYMTYLSLALAFILAFAFQLNSFAILKRLSTDPELRAKLDAAAVAIMQDGEEATMGGRPYDVVADEAIRQFSKEHSEAASAAEEVAGIGKDRATLEREMQDALEAHKVANSGQLVTAYGEIADKLHGAAAKEQFGKARDQVDQLALFDFVVWPHDWSYYHYTKVNNWLGVLVSAVFISLGAPFWFNTLKNLMNMRDMLKPRAQDSRKPE